MVKYLALASSVKSRDGNLSTAGNSFVQPTILKLLVTWLADCPSAVNCFLDSRPHLTFLLELVSNESATVCIRGLAAVLLGECVIYNKSAENGKDAFAIVDTIGQKVGLTTFFLKFDEMQKSYLFASASSAQPRKPLTRSTAASMADIEDVDDNDLPDQKNKDHPSLLSIFDAHFVNLVQSLEADIREKIVEVYSLPKSKVAVVPADLEQKSGESDGAYIKRLKAFVEKQCSEIQVSLSVRSHAFCSLLNHSYESIKKKITMDLSYVTPTLDHNLHVCIHVETCMIMCVNLYIYINVSFLIFLVGSSWPECNFG